MVPLQKGSNLNGTTSNRQIGKTTSKTIHKIFTSRAFSSPLDLSLPHHRLTRFAPYRRPQHAHLRRLLPPRTPFRLFLYRSFDFGILIVLCVAHADASGTSATGAFFAK